LHQVSDATTAEVRELRLALVCYGGVSLAIYMHGVTKEVQKLVLASTAFERDTTTNPFEADDSAYAYWNLLSRLERGDVQSASRPSRLVLRVVVDVISGTSAGGINGVCLAKALAGNHSQDALRDLWLERGDIKQLLRGWRRLPVWVRALGLPFPNPLKMRPLLRGDDMSRWLYGAFEEMGRTVALQGVRSLIPPDHELQLFVPITDFHGYERDVPLHDPRYVRDHTHRHVLEFSHREPGGGNLGSEFDHALSFAARATASFPGAFPPISFSEYDQAFPGAVDLSAITSPLFRLYELSGADPRRTQFIDGGVLDNFPFRSSIDAIAAKPAATEIDRRLLFIEPDPGEVSVDPPAGAMPGLWRTAFAAYASIPRKEPILDDLLRLTFRNTVVLRVRDVVEANFTSISRQVTEILRDELGVVPDPPSAGDLVGLRQRLEDRAARDAGFGFRAYARLRVNDVVGNLSAAVAEALRYPPESPQYRFIAAALHRWASAEHLFDQEPNDARLDAQRDFVAKFDLAYHERRIRFLIAALNWWYREVGDPRFPKRLQLDEGKKLLYAHVWALRAIITHLAQQPAVTATVRQAFSTTEIQKARGDNELYLDEFLAQHSQQLTALRKEVEPATTSGLASLEERLHGDLLEMMEDWTPEVRGALVTRYLGFPFWDILVYPLQALSGVGERDHVEVYRVSPRDVRLLGPADSEARRRWERRKLQGMSLFHFGAFFDRPGRERDYLWGRLDGAERLVGLLLDAGSDPAATVAAGVEPLAIPHDVLAEECAPVFEAILDSERRCLTRAGELIRELDQLTAGLRRRT